MIRFSQGVITAVSLLTVCASAPARAQVIERNLPPAATAPPPAQAAATPPAETDATPIGPALTAIVALGPSDPVRAVAAGLDLAAARRLDNPAGRRALRPFLGRPLSRRVIAEVSAAITRIYRAAGFPFLSVTTPEQDIGGGVLQLRVIEFRAGRIAASGSRRTPAGHVAQRVRQRAGEPIDARRLTEDIDWLNRNPFRQIGTLFSPGAGLGLTDISLPIVEQRPWRVYAGGSTSGSDTTGRVRLFAGAQATHLPGLADAILSYQITGSPEAVTNAHPLYRSHAVRLTAPLAPRQAIEISYDHVDTSQAVQDFVSRQRVDEAAIGYRFALSNLTPRLAGPVAFDVTAGVEVRRATRRLLFGDADVSGATADVIQSYAGYVATELDARGRTTLAMTLHVSPGGIDGHNDGAALAAYAGASAARATYAYVNGQASRVTRLSLGFAATTEVTFQYAAASLPTTERAAIGGAAGVRGYTLDDGGFDSVIISHNALLAPTITIPRTMLGGGVLQPRLSIDAGYGRDNAARRSVTTLSTGGGVDYRLGGVLQLGADASCALADAPHTRAGHCRVEARITLSR